MDRVRRDDRAPDRVLLRGVKQQLGGLAVQQLAMPQAAQPRIPRQDRRRLPVSEAKRALTQIVGAMQGPCGALIGGYDGPAALQRLLHLPGQLGGRVHTPFIRLPVAENATAEAWA